RRVQHRRAARGRWFDGGLPHPADGDAGGPEAGDRGNEVDGPREPRAESRAKIHMTTTAPGAHAFDAPSTTPTPLAVGAMREATFRVWRGDASGGAFVDYRTPVSEGMVVLDAIHQIQADQASDLAVRWNCKAGKCGSCSAEINGKPKLMCMTRLNE